MPLDLSDTLVIGISATALFDLSEADKLFRTEFAKDRDNAIDVYRRYTLERENEPLATGTGLPLVGSLLRLKHLSPDEERPLVEVVVMSRNSPETGLRVLNTIRHLKLDITRSVFTGGESVVDYLDAFDVDLFLTTYAKDAQRVMDSKVCPAALLATPLSGIDALRDDQVRIAFDGDAVLFDESSELVYKTEGLTAFQTAEDQAQDRPLAEGPYATFLKKLARLQERLPGRIEFSPVRIALVPARNSPAELRAIKTLRHWGVYVDEAFFLGGLGKHRILEAFKPHIFFDDQDVHLEEAAGAVPAGKVAYRSDSPLRLVLSSAGANTVPDVGALENEVYNHLFSFFRRYYSEGDFLAKRVYKPGVYAIPYEGEEVKLHWANRDQYYIKTSEYLRDYAFRLRPDDDKKPMRVHFRLVDAAEGEHGNVKAAEGKDRVFILAAGNFIAEENGQLSLRFEYRPSTLTDWPEDARDRKTRPPVQKDLIALATRRVLALADASFAAWIAELEKPHVSASGEKADYTRLEAHLRRYTARNTFDYFIHKDLSGFLRRELDFYIKNEVMHLDDVEHETAPRVEQYLSKIKVIRRIAGKIIDFLAQLEDFQKKLWLKKKFVVETHYCITLDRIPEEFYPEIAANDAQREEWVRLFAIDEITADLTTPGYRVPLEVDFLKAQPYLVLDTKFFADDWTAQLVDRIESFEEQQEGLLIHADNFDALNLLAHRYAREVSVAFIDPPYNTGVDGFPYKDSYQHASWLVQHGGNPSPPLTPPC